MTSPTEIFVVEFSVKQQAFHKQTLDEMIVNNIKNIFFRIKTDYLPIGVFKSSEDANKFIELVYEEFKKSETDLQQDSAIEYFKKI